MTHGSDNRLAGFDGLSVAGTAARRRHAAMSRRLSGAGRKAGAAGQRRRRRGAALVYVTGAMVGLIGVCSLAVDYARCQVVKTELHRAAYAAARAGAAFVHNSLDGTTSAAYQYAYLEAKNNTYDGSNPVLLDTANDIQVGIWISATQTFVPVSDPALANAVHVTARCAASRGTGVPLVFMRLFGVTTTDLSADSIAVASGGTSVQFTVPATSNPFLAGMPPGSVASLNNPHNDPDYAGTAHTPLESPVQTAGISIVPGQYLSFDGIDGNGVGGQANNMTSNVNYTADGNLGWICNNTAGDDNHIANMINDATGSDSSGAPINSLVGVFLSNSAPDQTATPATHLDFSTDAQRDYNTLNPGLKQIFFIGDGRNSAGKVQQVKVPPGATRLYLATWDAYEWSNNQGGFTPVVHQNVTVSTVK